MTDLDGHNNTDSSTNSSSVSSSQGTATKTEVGNYFIANYPPFSFWRPDQVPPLLDVLDRAPKPDTPLGVYLHIPFCRKRCHFCYFRVYTDRNAEQIKSYLDSVIAEMKLYSEKQFIGGRKPQFFYFGGGTPSYLASKQLNYLAEGLSSLVDWSVAEEVTFECEPGTLNETKLQTLKDLGVTRLSLGVENFDEHVLEANNRAHQAKQIYSAYETARKVGFAQINIDLISGMLGETDENWQRNIDETLRLAPDSVTIYQMEIPYNTTIYKDMKASGKDVAPVADWPTKRRWVKEAFEQLEANGYRIGSAYTAVRKDNAETRFVYRDSLWNGADLLPLGVSSFGHIQGVHLQNQHDSTPYESFVNHGQLPIYRAYHLDDKERLIREFILQLKLGTLGFAKFEEKFGVNPKIVFKKQLDELVRLGVASVSETEVQFTRDGLLTVDRYLPQFFKDDHRNARYA